MHQLLAIGVKFPGFGLEKMKLITLSQILTIYLPDWRSSIRAIGTYPWSLCNIWRRLGWPTISLQLLLSGYSCVCGTLSRSDCALGDRIGKARSRVQLWHSHRHRGSLQSTRERGLHSCPGKEICPFDFVKGDCNWLALLLLRRLDLKRRSPFRGGLTLFFHP